MPLIEARPQKSGPSPFRAHLLQVLGVLACVVACAWLLAGKWKPGARLPPESPESSVTGALPGYAHAKVVPVSPAVVLSKTAAVPLPSAGAGTVQERADLAEQLAEQARILRRELASNTNDDSGLTPSASRVEAIVREGRVIQ